jgi:hypothetical protein
VTMPERSATERGPANDLAAERGITSGTRPGPIRSRSRVILETSASATMRARSKLASVDAIRDRARRHSGRLLVAHLDFADETTSSAAEPDPQAAASCSCQDAGFTKVAAAPVADDESLVWAAHGPGIRLRAPPTFASCRDMTSGSPNAGSTPRFPTASRRCRRRPAVTIAAPKSAPTCQGRREHW